MQKYYLPGRVHGIDVVDVFVGQGMGFVCSADRPNQSQHKYPQHFLKSYPVLNSLSFREIDIKKYGSQTVLIVSSNFKTKTW